jgi:hypothetical protein
MVWTPLGSIKGPPGPPGDGEGGGAAPVNGLLPLSEWQGAHSASFHPDMGDSASTVGTVFFARLLVPAGKSITKAAVEIRGTATAPSATDCYGIYDAAGIKIGETAGSNTLFTALGLRWANLITPIAAQDVDRYVWVSLFAANPSGMSIMYKNGAGDLAGRTTNRRAFFDAVAALPASINPVTQGTTSLQYIPFYMLG